MKIFISALFLIVFVGSGTAFIQDIQDYWPRLIKRCGRNDPQLGVCMQILANEALLPVLMGDPSIGLTNLLENQDYNLIVRNISLGKNQPWKVNFAHANYYGLPHVSVEEMSWDFDNHIINVNFSFVSSITINGVYTSSGTLGGQDFSGIGNADIVLLGGASSSNITYSMNYNLLNVGGLDYVQVRNATCEINSPYRFEFTNLAQSPEFQINSMADVLNANADAFTEEISPQINNICASLVSERFNPFFLNFPLSMIFV